MLLNKKEIPPPPPPPPPPDHDAVSIISSLMRAELSMHAKQHAWAKIEQLLNDDPDVARAVDPTNGDLPLHVLSGNAKADPLIVDICILKYPNGLMKRNNDGALPLHAAAATGSVDVVKIVFMAYKDGRNAHDGMGRLPLHVAIENNAAAEVVEFLLAEDPSTSLAVVQKPEQTPESFAGGLPIHCACRSRSWASSKLLDILLTNETAKTKDYQGNLPLHLLLTQASSVDLGTIKKVHAAYPSSLKRKDSIGDTPLIIALKYSAKSEIVDFLLREYSEAAKEASGDHRYALMLALENGFSDDIVMDLIDHFPSAVSVVDAATNVLPIELATIRRRSENLVKILLTKDLPIDVNDDSLICSIKPDSQRSLEHLVSMDEYSAVIVQILQSLTLSQRVALAKVPTIMDRAAPNCKRQLVVGTRMFGIIELSDIAPAYATDKTQIYYGVKYSGDTSSFVSKGVRVVFEDSNTNVASSEPTDIGEEAGIQVIVKLTSDQDLMQRELFTRRELSADLVPAILSVHHAANEVAANQTSPSYCITMECADNTLENILLDMRAQGREDWCFPLDDLLTIGETLVPLHDNGIVHGDFGSHNIGKFGDGKWKILSIGSSQSVGDATDPSRGYYFPPESLGQKKTKLKFKSRPKLISIESSPSIDIWAFGCLAYEVLTGETLPLYFRSLDREDNTVHVKAWNVKALSKATENLRGKNAVAADFVASLLHPNPSQRASSMNDVLKHELFYNLRSPPPPPLPPVSPPSPPPEKTPEEPPENVKDAVAEDSLPSPTVLRNRKDVVYATQPSLQESSKLMSSDDSAEKISLPMTYPIQERRNPAKKTSFPLQERTIYPIQEHSTVSTEDHSLTSCVKVDIDCYSTASTKFRDNTTRSGENASVPMQVVATEKKLTPPSSTDFWQDDQPKEKIIGQLLSKDLMNFYDDPYIDSDDESEPGRIIPGSRKMKRIANEHHQDLQMV